MSAPDRYRGQTLQLYRACPGLAMLMGDLFSLRQLKLPVKVIVFRPEALAFVEFEEGTSARKTVVRFIAVDWSSTARIETVAVAAR